MPSKRTGKTATEPVQLSAKTADGRQVEGTVKDASGKFLGGDLKKLTQKQANERALRDVQSATKLAEQGKRSGLLEPSPHHTIVFARYTKKSGGLPVEIPLLGTKWTISLTSKFNANVQEKAG